MKKIRWILFVLLAVVLGYATWILQPHLGMVEVTDNAGLSQEDVQEIVKHLKSANTFHGRGEIGTVLSSALSPRTRPRYFVEITGDPSNIDIKTGYVRGELWGGGPFLRAKKIEGRWLFEKTSILWRQ